ncbi:MAG: ADP-heptose--LPS heptosyltransferase, partial [Acidobacteriota bacterium]
RFATDCDALGAVCRLVGGEDAAGADRQAFRAFVARRLAGADQAGTDLTRERELAERLYLETDWTLPPPGRTASGEW